MGAAVRKPSAKEDIDMLETRSRKQKAVGSKVKSGIERLKEELHSENWPKKVPAAPQAPEAEGSVNKASPSRWGANKASPTRWGAVEGKQEEDQDDDFFGKLPPLPADFEFTTPYLSSSDEEFDIVSEEKISRVRRLMEPPVEGVPKHLDEVSVGKMPSNREIRTMLSEAHRNCQRHSMKQFIEECKKRLENEEDRENILPGEELKLRRSLLKQSNASAARQREKREKEVPDKSNFTDSPYKNGKGRKGEGVKYQNRRLL